MVSARYYPTLNRQFILFRLLFSFGNFIEKTDFFNFLKYEKLTCISFILIEIWVLCSASLLLFFSFPL
jgi:hypothetical protein